MVVRRVSTTPEHPGWVFIKCLNDGNGYKFWYREEEYNDILIERNLVHVRALLASIEAVNETSALVAKLEARHETRCEEEATSTSGLKKKGGCQIEPPPPQINNECIEKALTQLKGLGFLSIKLLGNRAESESESEFLNWDDIPVRDPVDGLNLSDLMDYDPLALDADDEETNCPARSTLGLRDPRLMLQIFAMHLSISESYSYPVSVFGIVAVRDALEPLRNLVFNRPCRDNAFMVDQLLKTILDANSALSLAIGAAAPPVQVCSRGLCVVLVHSDRTRCIDRPEPNVYVGENNRIRTCAKFIDSLTLPLCSPRRGMYLVRDRALLEVDLWVKEEGDGSSDKQLLSLYAEFEGMYQLDEMLDGEVSSDLGSLVIDYLLLDESVEAVIQVSAKIDCPHHMRFTAFTSGFDGEIVLFDGKFSGNGKLFQYVVAVKAEGKLDICLKLEESLFWWTFQEGAVGAVRFPDDSVLNYGQFEVTVLFAPKNFTMAG
ncbi:hypothetical protein TRIUR3_27736 [Triticum urartu]|uniref:DUF6598 domain-containing protein n=1 Tax=Triticum urartu TaxID=4572 RepID=M7ZQR1_TRIUA|nr:hypothetical protein TRIUR3_27736 [Triticum urartu]